jgi:REP-associated tyrosine transposase
MSEKYKMSNVEGIYFLTLTVVDWIDLFTRKEYKHIIINSLKHCQKDKGLVIYAYCIMPSHLHLIVASENNPLSEIIRDFKKFTTKAILREMDLINESRKEWLKKAFENAGKNIKRITHFKLWKDGNRPKELVSNQFSQQKLDYLHMNPVESEIVDEPEFYWYSSARDYAGHKGLIDVEFII